MKDNNDKNKDKMKIGNKTYDLDNDVQREEAVFAFETVCYDLAYAKLVEGFIFESEVIFDTMEFYIRDEKTERVKFLVGLLNKYYNGFLSEKFNTFLKEENYEMCEKLKDLI